MAARLKPYHWAWLAAHPERSQQWLRDRLADGFDVHHADGNHTNDDPDNLVLIEVTDHAKLHLFEAGFSRMSAAEANRARIRRLDERFQAAGLVRGAYTSKIIKGRVYWYFQDAKTRKQQYIGLDSPEVRSTIEAYNHRKRTLESN
jgi:hypothetical protein